ncbi:hypothetical protein THRCLA_20360 [Thraustotheca clavata]|uniref:HTH CENPB-type domain-containing protein n=1 Tax=Thraustotheca clavata TaxID=74557 RepID=A0A1W0A895_9STRA|nr:hypothetical protein THRCLA_20360 [Thraustotheca clavata]
MLKEQALQFASDFFSPQAVFKATQSWINGFLKRHHLSYRSRTRQGQCSNKDGESVRDQFASEVLAPAGELGVSVIYNTDQTGVKHEYLHTKTIDLIGASRVWIKSAKAIKELTTAMLLGGSTEKSAQAAANHITQEESEVHRGGLGHIVYSEIEEIHENRMSNVMPTSVLGGRQIFLIAFLNITLETEIIQASYCGMPSQGTLLKK